MAKLQILFAHSIWHIQVTVDQAETGNKESTIQKGNNKRFKAPGVPNRITHFRIIQTRKYDMYICCTRVALPSGVFAPTSVHQDCGEPTTFTSYFSLTRLVTIIPGEDETQRLSSY